MFALAQGRPGCVRSILSGVDYRVPSMDMTVAGVLSRWPLAARVFVRRRMACVGCAMARFERVADAARIYGVKPAVLSASLRRATRATGTRR